MTKFILHGGNLGDENIDNYGFFEEMVRSSKPDLNLLMTYFSSDEDRVEDKYNRHSTTFRRFAKDKIVNFRLAKVHEFAEQTKMG
jgi:hypothetical protein